MVEMEMKEEKIKKSREKHENSRLKKQEKTRLKGLRIKVELAKRWNTEFAEKKGDI